MLGDFICGLSFHEEESEPAPDCRDQFGGSQKYPEYLGEPQKSAREYDLQCESQERSHRRSIQQLCEYVEVDWTNAQGGCRLRHLEAELQP